MNKQCSDRPAAQPACWWLLLLALPPAVIPASGAAQDRYRVSAAENFRQEPGPDGRLLARVNEGVAVRGGETRDGWVEVTLEGWIWGRSVRESPSADYDLVVGAASGENLREGPNGRVVARLLRGFLLDEVTRRDGWVHVRRTGWMWGRTLAREQAAPVASAPAPRPPARAEEGRMVDRMSLAARAALLATPDGDTVGQARGAMPARVLARTDGWVRVQVEGWVRDTDLSPAGDSVLLGVSGAEVRSGGAGYEGRLVRWMVQFVAIQTADELRRDMAPGQRYALTRGPLPEAGFVYVTLTPAQAGALDGVAPLTFLTIVARVRTARSRYLGNPILELVDYRVGDE
jgi:hypothetical protein